MKKFLQYCTYIPLVLTLFVSFTLSDPVVYAQNDGMAISGDEICGQWDPVLNKIKNPCEVKSIGVISKRILTYVIGLGLPLLVVFIVYRFVMAWFALQQGNASAYKDALNKSWNAALGFFLIVALFGGLLFTLLKFLGVKDSGGLQFFNFFSEAFVTHAYAQGAPQTLPNPLGVTNLYDFILSILRLIMRFFIYPMMITIWVWTGFGFVMAQGNPEGLSKAKKWLIWAFVTTLVVFMLQAFLIAIRGTVNAILPGAATQGVTPAPAPAPDTNGTLDGRVAPTPGELGSVCTNPDGTAGQVGNGGKCYARVGVVPASDPQFCDDKPFGTLCSVPKAGGATVTGTCTDTGSGKKECAVAKKRRPVYNTYWCSWWEN
jgi:hypothetical protein